MSEEGQFGPFTGRASVPVPVEGPRPLVIAIHAGTYSSRYFDVADHSLLERAERNGIHAIAIDRYGYGGTPFTGDMSILGQAAVPAGPVCKAAKAGRGISRASPPGTRRLRPIVPHDVTRRGRNRTMAKHSG